MDSGCTDARRTSGRRWFPLIALVATLIGIGGWSASTAQAQEAPALIRVVHGLRGLVADVYLNGTLVLPTFQPERSTDPLTVPAGDHVIEIRTAGAAMTEVPLLTQTVTVPGGFQGSLVAHLDRNGAPTLTAFADDLGAVPAGESRFVVRHAAAAEDVSVLLNDVAAISSITSKSEAGQNLSAGTYQLAVAPVAGGSPLAAPQSVDYADGTANFMYLIGSQAEGTLGWAVVRVDGLQSAPTIIQTGDGSMRDSGGADSSWMVLVVAGAVATGGLTMWSRTRRTAPVR